MEKTAEGRAPPRMRLASLAQIDGFDSIIDVRSPAEFAQDHVPGAINCPVLDDAERARIGTMYQQVSPFAARRAGAVLVARNIARHIEERFQDNEKGWRPLVYCWRGGQRSEAMAIILNQVGWKAAKLEGGYKNWRQGVLQTLASLPEKLDFRLLVGPTGSGKSRLLEALAAQGGQVLHLEYLAAHKGSVLGALPDRSQPSQKMFETRLYSLLSAFDPARPVFTEAESRRIGSVYLPNPLHAALAKAPCLKIEAPLSARVELLVDDYAWARCEREWLRERLLRLRDMHSGETMQRWLDWAAVGNFKALVSELLSMHYDPLYQRSQLRQFSQYKKAPVLALDNLDEQGLAVLAATILHEHDSKAGRREAGR